MKPKAERFSSQTMRASFGAGVQNRTEKNTSILEYFSGDVHLTEHEIFSIFILFFSSSEFKRHGHV